MSLRFSGSWPCWIILLVGFAGALVIARWYWRESRNLPNALRWLLPALRAAAFFLIVFMLAGPTLYYRRVEGELSRLRILIDVSKSMDTVDDSTRDVSRLSRVWRLLGGDAANEKSPPGWLKLLSQYHRVQVLALNNNSMSTPIWDSQMNTAFPSAESIDHSENSPLGEFLYENIDQRSVSQSLNTKFDSNRTKSDQVAVDATILISDGQLNAGMSIEDSVSGYFDEKIPIFAIGLGSTKEPEDLGILEIEHSLRVYRLDRFRGTIALKERIKAGTPYRVEIKHLGQTVFSTQLKSMDQGLRRVEFELPAEQLIDRSKEHLQTGIEYASLPIDLQFSVDCNVPEITLANNTFASSLWGIEKKNRVLILDRRGGWEMRYIKNALQRDATWDTSVAVGRGAFEKEYFPTTRAKLFEYDLIIASLDTVCALPSAQQSWISDFVGVVGGGLILVDSKRERKSSTLDSSLVSLLPVSWIDSAESITPQSLQVSSLAKNQPALQISSDALPNDQVWSRLLVPHSLRPVQLKPGAEALVETMGAKADEAPYPLVVTKMFGQGRVLYFASDETWRWRYNVADLYHQRFWNQIATWGMRTHFAVRDVFACLDSGPRVYSTEDSVTVRASLKQSDLGPLEKASACVVLECNGEPHSTIPLTESVDASGFYQTTFGPMPKGSYRLQLEVAGVPLNALKLQTQFVVQAPIDIEMQNLACDTTTLMQASTMTGGEFVMIEEAATILEKLKPFRFGRIVESQTLLWQSYPWFASIVGLLAIEWYLRKRAGLA